MFFYQKSRIGLNDHMNFILNSVLIVFPPVWESLIYGDYRDTRLGKHEIIQIKGRRTRRGGHKKNWLHATKEQLSRVRRGVSIFIFIHILEFVKPSFLYIEAIHKKCTYIKKL